MREAAEQRWPLIIIFLTVFIDLIGFGIVFPIISYYAESNQMTGTQIGIFLGAYSLMQFIFAPVLGRWSDRIGRRPVLILSLFGTGISYLMLGFAASFWFFLLSRTLDGISGSSVSVAQAYIADITEPHNRTKRLGAVIGSAYGLGFALGPALGALLLNFGNPSLPYFVAGAIAIANAIAAIILLPESLTIRRAEHRIGFRTFSLRYLTDQLLSPVLGTLFIVYAVMILAFASMEATFSLLAKHLFHISGTDIYWIFFYLGIVMTLVQGGLIRPLAKTLGETKMIVLGNAIMAISLFLIPQQQTLWWAYLTMGVLALGNGLCSPCLMSLISQRSSATEQGEKLGAAQSLASLSRFLGPLFGGIAFHRISPASPYLIAAAVMGLVLLISLQLLRSESRSTATSAESAR
ncbi:MAG: MFS transporter [Acidobacteriota bacterium]